jgi:phage baseplate assembly protein W|tara:strand:- start:874 stop:1260 length:387 start_codon:yes stop_codon:yes gene_type:complete
MAYGYSAVLPLQRDDTDGFYVLTKTIPQNIKQNFKNLLLTTPGERVMIPDFGVGLRRFLFENNSFELQDKISERIDNQVSLYMPFVAVNQVQFFDQANSLKSNFGNLLSLRIIYSIPGMSISDTLVVD